VLAASENHLLVHSRVIGRRRTAVSFANTRTPPERKGGVFGTLMQGFLDDCWFLLFNQLRFLRRFMRLLTRSGFCVGNTACNNLAAVLDDFPIPATVFAVGHNAEFNVFHQFGPSA